MCDENHIRKTLHYIAWIRRTNIFCYSSCGLSRQLVLDIVASISPRRWVYSSRSCDYNWSIWRFCTTLDSYSEDSTFCGRANVEGGHAKKRAYRSRERPPPPCKRVNHAGFPKKTGLKKFPQKNQFNFSQTTHSSLSHFAHSLHTSLNNGSS